MSDIIKKENTYVVVKREDTLKHLEEPEQIALEATANTMPTVEEEDGTTKAPWLETKLTDEEKKLYGDLLSILKTVRRKK